MPTSTPTTFSSPELFQLFRDWKMSDRLALSDQPRIVVAGAFEGKLIRLLAEMYPHHKEIVGFEPQAWAADRCLDNTQHLERVTIVPSGLHTHRRKGSDPFKLDMGEWGTDACSVLGAPREQGIGWFANAFDQLDRFVPIDLFVMNMEGYEYELLPYLAEKGPTYIRQFAVQFHVQYEKSPLHTQRLLAGMGVEYGTPIYDDYPRWVYWAGQQE